MTCPSYKYRYCGGSEDPCIECSANEVNYEIFGDEAFKLDYLYEFDECKYCIHDYPDHFEDEPCARCVYNWSLGEGRKNLDCYYIEKCYYDPSEDNED